METMDLNDCDNGDTPTVAMVRWVWWWWGEEREGKCGTWCFDGLFWGWLPWKEDNESFLLGCARLGRVGRRSFSGRPGGKEPPGYHGARAVRRARHGVAFDVLGIVHPVGVARSSEHARLKIINFVGHLQSHLSPSLGHQTPSTPKVDIANVRAPDPPR